MYQVVELYGQFEPWWFLEDWKEDIVAVETVDTFDEALKIYQTKWLQFKRSHPYHHSKESLLAAFWDEENQSFCEDCDEHLQDYRSLALLKNWEEVPERFYQPGFNQRNDQPKPLSACKIKKIG